MCKGTPAGLEVVELVGRNLDGALVDKVLLGLDAELEGSEALGDFIYQLHLGGHPRLRGRGRCRVGVDIHGGSRSSHGCERRVNRVAVVVVVVVGSAERDRMGG